MLELSLVKLSRPELDLVKLSRPGWFVPNSSDLVKAKALQQKEDLPKNFFSKFPSLLPYQLQLTRCVGLRYSVQGTRKMPDLQPMELDRGRVPSNGMSGTR